MLAALAAQALGFMLIAALAIARPGLFTAPWQGLLAQSLLAPLCAAVFGQPPWWLAIHALFWPLVALVLWLGLPTWLYPLLLLLSVLVFWGTVGGEVPLFLSSPAVADAVIRLVEKEATRRFADLGAGLGNVAAPLARRCPGVRVDAFEHAPLPWLITASRCRGLANARVLRANFWRAGLGDYDVVFAFLSPAAMTNLAAKLSRDMRPGSLLVSSSFPIPDWTPESVLTVADRRQTRLFCYRVGYER